MSFLSRHHDSKAAYPVSKVIHHRLTEDEDKILDIYGENGIDIRDYFAIRIAEGMISGRYVFDAEEAYEKADKMIEARNK